MLLSCVPCLAPRGALRRASAEPLLRVSLSSALAPSRPLLICLFVALCVIGISDTISLRFWARRFCGRRRSGGCTRAEGVGLAEREARTAQQPQGPACRE